MGSDGREAVRDTKLDRRRVLTGAATLAFAGSLPSACCPCAATTNTWNNAIRTAGADPDHFLTPASLKDVVEIVQKAEREGKRVRMTGSGHSFSDVALTEDYLLSPVALTRALPLDRSELRSDAPEGHYVRVESGIRIRDLNLHLDRHGKALANMGGYDAQTIVGAATTGTHGSGLHYGPISSQIVSLELVTTGGRVLKVEPADGITGSFPNFVRTPSGNVPAELIRDTGLFNALTVSLGSMGVVYAVVLKVVPAFWLREKRIETTWGALRAPGGFLERVMKDLPPDVESDRNPAHRSPEHYEIYVSPYPRKRGHSSSLHPCLLTKRYRIPPPTSRTQGERRRGRTGDHVLVASARISKRGQGLAEFMNDNPLLVPWVLHQSVKALVDRDDYVAKSFDVFHLGPLNAMRVDGIEMSFGLEQTIAATERMFVEAAKLKAEGRFHSSPPSLRFVERAAAELSMANGRRTTTLEMAALVCANGSADLLGRYERLYIDEFRARPHWGLDHNILKDFNEVEALYGDAARRWLSVFRRLNTKGTFDGALTDRLKISMRPRDV
jgi:L-gulono-1,4-lactone dehydrogenase